MANQSSVPDDTILPQSQLHVLDAEKVAVDPRVTTRLMISFLPYGCLTYMPEGISNFDLKILPDFVAGVMLI